MSRHQQQMLVGGFLILMGVMISLAAFDTGPMSSASKNAPNWIIGLSGAFFVACGTLLLKPGPLLAQFVAGISMLSITIICAWIALFGEAQYFSSDWSVLSPTTELMLARSLFGLVALLGLAISINAIRTYLKRDP